MISYGRKGYEVSLFFLPFSALSDGLPADSPVVGLDFFNDDTGGLRVLPQNILKHPGHSLDKLFLLLGSSAFFGDLDIHVWHKSLSYFSDLTTINHAAAADARRKSSDSSMSCPEVP